MLALACMYIKRMPSSQLPPHQTPGTLPVEWSSLSMLRDLFLANNSLNGTIPYTGGAAFMAPLRTLDITNNRLSGALPPELSAAEQLLLSYNQLTGQLGPALNGAVNLRRLVAPGNNFYGWLPDLSAAAQLVEVDLGMNMLTGALPGSFSSKGLQRLWLEGNIIGGSVPDAVRSSDARLLACVAFVGVFVQVLVAAQRDVCVEF
jgi:hypothetical protein